MDLCTYTELGMLMRRQANVEHVGDADCGSFAAVSKHLSTSPGSTDLDALVASIADDPFDLDEPMTVQPTVDSHSQNTLVPSLCEVKSKQSQILKSESVEPAAANKPSFHKIEVEPLAVERSAHQPCIYHKGTAITAMYLPEFHRATAQAVFPGAFDEQPEH
eukprot:SAG31_NODE_532_length_14374_cov_30.565254_18_plen_162_part_00